MKTNINTNHINIKSNQFEQAVIEYSLKYSIEQIIETGTNIGLGSTTLLAKTGLPVITLECNPVTAKIAESNLKQYPMVRVINCLSLKKEDMYNFLINDKYSFDSSIMVDTDKPLEFYMNELNHNVVEDILYPLISNNTRQLIFLDSAGGIGYLEYQKVMSLSKDQLNQKVLILDDIYHIKHHRSVLDLKNKGYAVQEYDRFCVVKL